MRTPYLCLLVALASCVDPPLASPVPHDECQPTITIREVRNKVDVLFMVDNSRSMQPMSDELQNRFSSFLDVFSQLAKDPKSPSFADLQIGVVTSDYGAGGTGASGACDASPGGQRGRLQALPSPQAMNAPADCKAPLGANFIKYAFGAGGADTHNLPPGQDLAKTFTCMASVGSNGCGYEHPLESVYAALHNDIPENVGFLRKDALLAVVFLTNEDDASAPPDTDIFDGAKSALYGFADSYSRQTRPGVVCGPDGAEPPYDASGVLTDCRPAPNPGGAGPGREWDVHRYIDFLSRRGGVKDDPNDVILVGIDGPSSPFQVVLSNPNPGETYPPCAPLDESKSCVPVLQHSCQNARNAAFYADPAVRLNAVIASAANHQRTDICADSFADALKSVADLIAVQLGEGCISVAQPDCVVEDVTVNDDGTTDVHRVPACADSPGANPCWLLEKKPACADLASTGMGITIHRGAMMSPRTTARVACGTPC